MDDPKYKTADGSALRIWRDAVQNKFASEKAGRPIFDEVIYVEVISPGSGNSTVIFEVVRNYAPEVGHPEPEYGTKYAEYKIFIDLFEKDETDSSMSGTPLSEWPEMTKRMVAGLKAQQIFTVDALAALPDNRLGIVGPDGRTWREKAIAYLANAKDGAFATQIAADLDRERQANADLREQVGTLAKQVEGLMGQIAGQGAPPAPATAPEEPKAPKVVKPAQAAPVDPLAEPLTLATHTTATAAPII